MTLIWMRLMAVCREWLIDWIPDSTQLLMMLHGLEPRVEG
jgi:hypothetical protein